jgi:preprotein translocase subunit YajC
MMKPLTSKLFAAALIAAAPAVATAAPPVPASASAVKVGMKVVDTANAEVGMIVARNDTTVTLKTDAHEIPLSSSSFTVQGGKAYFGMTRAQVNAEFEKSMAAAQASLVPGAVVKGLNGNRLGTIASIDEQKVVLKLDSGQSVELPRSGIAGRADGAVAGITAEDLAAKVAAN